MDTYDRYREPPRGCRFTFIICIIITLLFLVFCASGCGVLPSHSRESEEINIRDSIIFHHVYDTTRVTITDTTHVEVHSSKQTETGTNIQFGAGGGTYNSKTGEATNVASVKQSSKSTETEDLIREQKTQIDAFRATTDSLTAQVEHYASEIAKERQMPKRTGWDRFCTWWFIITALLLLGYLGYKGYRLYLKFKTGGLL